MNKNVIIVGTVGAVLLLGLYAYSVNDNSEPAAASDGHARVSVINEHHDFGEIDIFGGHVETSYILKNEGPGEVTITGAETSCMCTEGEIAGYTFGMHGSKVRSVVIPEGGEEVVTATFDPMAHGPNGTGKITRVLTLMTDSDAAPIIELRFSGEVIKPEDN